MIILDIETSGLDPYRNALLSIGAVDYETGEEFYGECHVGNRNEIDDAALAINGFTRSQVYFDATKPDDEFPLFRDELYAQFWSWCQGRDCLIAGQQVGAFDLRFLKVIHDGIERHLNPVADPIIVWDFPPPPPEAYIHHEGIKHVGKWPFGYRSLDLHSVAFAKLGKSLSLDRILQTVGLELEPKPHNALTGARLERDAFKRLLQ